MNYQKILETVKIQPYEVATYNLTELKGEDQDQKEPMRHYKECV